MVDPFRKKRYNKKTCKLVLMSQKNDDQSYPHHVAVALNHIEELKLNGRHQESINEAEKLLFDNPDCVEALEEIADNYVSLDEHEKAEKACHRALKLNKDSYTAKYILGFIRSQKQEWKEATNYLKSSNSLHPNNPEILRCLGWAMFNGNKRTQGIVVLERSLNIDPDNPLTLCDLGICYMQVKNFDKSIQLLKRAMQLDPNNRRVKDCFEAANAFRDKFLGIKK